MSSSPRIPESAHQLLAGPNTAILSTIAPNGTVQSTAIWFIHDAASDTILISITDDRKKFRNLVANPKATFFLLDPANHWSFVEIRGTVTIEADPQKTLMTQIGVKHETDVSGFDKPGQNRQRVTLTPETVNAR